MAFLMDGSVDEKPKSLIIWLPGKGRAAGHRRPARWGAAAGRLPPGGSPPAGLPPRRPPVKRQARRGSDQISAGESLHQTWDAGERLERRGGARIRFRSKDERAVRDGYGGRAAAVAPAAGAPAASAPRGGRRHSAGGGGRFSSPWSSLDPLNLVWGWGLGVVVRVGMRFLSWGQQFLVIFK